MKLEKEARVWNGFNAGNWTNRKSIHDILAKHLWSLKSGALCRRARRRTGLSDFGIPPVEPALSVLGDSLENEANLHPLGRFLMREHLLEILELRLRLTAEWSQQDALTLSPVQRPLFITGMPRSGSTFLHELLSLDPESRSPKVWEIMFPLPAPEPEGKRRDWRVLRANARLWWFRQMAPHADQIYPMRACTPHECVAIHSFTFLSEEFISTCRIPKYETFLHSVGLAPAYAWQKRFLQHLQSSRPAKRWVLKSPDHLHSLQELFSTFPDAVIIHTHRNPLEVLRSSLQLTRMLHGVFGWPGDPEELRDRESRVLAQMMEKSIHFRDSHPEIADRFLDVNYSDLARDPMAVIFRIYEHLNRPLSQHPIQRMRQLVSSRSRYHHQHHPTLSDLGLDVSAESRRFRNYCLRFGVAMTPA